MSTPTPPFTPEQEVAQEFLTQAIGDDEQLMQAAPPPVTVTYEQKNKLAGDLWLAAGGVPDSPLTMNFWLEAEAILLTQTE
jgi:hypothetical protein